MRGRHDRPVSRRGLLVGGGAAAAAAVDTTGVAGAQATNIGDWLSDASNYTGLSDRTGEGTVEVTVGTLANGGNFGFGPPAIRVDPGTTVRWVWNGEGGTHNVVSNEEVDGEALFSSGDPVLEAGTTYEREFGESGVFEYYCDPHLAVGMKGVVVVGDVAVDEGLEPAGDGGGWSAPGGPFGSVFFGVIAGAAALAALAVLGGESYRAVRDGALDRAAGYEPMDEPEGPVEETAETPDAEPIEALGHDDYDPWGTATLVAFYMAILVGMWIFVYFVEFLGNGPTVTG